MKNIISQDERNISMTVKEWQGRTFMNSICRALDTVYPKIYSINCLTDHPRNYHFKIEHNYLHPFIFISKYCPYFQHK